MRQIDFFVSGTPIAQPRPRMTRRGHAYTPDNGIAEWKALVVAAAKEAGLEQFKGPLYVEILFHMPRPAGHYNKSGLKPTAPARWHTQRPDKDNLEKGVLDALTENEDWLGAWHDDRQIADSRSRKVWAATGGAAITIRELCE